MNLVELKLFGIVLNCLKLLKSYKWMDWIGLDWMDWMDPVEKPSPLRAPAVLIKAEVDFGIFLTMILLISLSLAHTFFVENHSGYFKPALFVRLVSVRGAPKASEEGGVCRSREDGEAGNLVVLQQLQVLLRVRVGHFYRHGRPIIKPDYLRPDLDAA